MRRRRLLASAPAVASSIAIVGCVSSTDGGPGSSDGDPDSTAEGPGSTDGDADSTDGGTESDATVTLEAEVLRSFAEEHPARVRLSFTNQTTERLLLSPGTMQGIPGPLTAIRGRRREDDRELLVFYRGKDVRRYARCADGGGSPIPDEPVDGCWRVACSGGLEVISAHGQLELAPEERITGEYTVLDGFDEGCLSSGTYEFADSTAVGPAVETDAGAEFDGEPRTLQRRLAITIEEGEVSASAEATATESDDSGSDGSGETPQKTPG